MVAGESLGSRVFFYSISSRFFFFAVACVYIISSRSEQDAFHCIPLSDATVIVKYRLVYLTNFLLPKISRISGSVLENSWSCVFFFGGEKSINDLANLPPTSPAACVGGKYIYRERQRRKYSPTLCFSPNGSYIRELER